MAFNLSNSATIKTPMLIPAPITAKDSKNGKSPRRSFVSKGVLEMGSRSAAFHPPRILVTYFVHTVDAAFYHLDTVVPLFDQGTILWFRMHAGGDKQYIFLV